MKKIILFTACALLCAGTALSQNYKHAIGLRAGGSNAALTYKQHLNAGNAFEVMALRAHNSNVHSREGKK